MAAGLGALVSLGSMAGCGTDGQVQKATSIKIGVTVYDQYDTFVSQMMTDFNEYAAEQEEQTGIAINVEVYNAAGSQSTQNSQVENMITEGCDVICVNLVDRTDPTAIIDLAEKNNIPVIFFNRELVEEDLERWTRLYYVGAQAFESGIMQGELAAEAFLTDQSLDKNGDGIINDGSELFGTGNGDGFADLARYDEDGNGWIDENDSIWSKLKIWCKDENGNDVLYKLSDKGVGAICLQNVSTDFTLQGDRKAQDGTTNANATNAVVRKTGIFLYENGNVGTVQHVDMAAYAQKA